MEKVYLDLYKNPHIREKYMFMVYEDEKKSNFLVAKDISQYLEKLVDKYSLDEIVLFGFSAGGVVASHIMSHMKHIPIEKKILAYDCPLDIYSMMIQQYNQYSRLDIYFYMIVRFFHEANTWEIYLDTIKHHMWKVGDKPVVFDLIKKIYNITDEEILHISRINMDQDDRTLFYFINCVNDPLFKISIRDKIVEKVREKKYRIEIYEKAWIGHCSDMAFSEHYLPQIEDILLPR